MAGRCTFVCTTSSKFCTLSILNHLKKHFLLTNLGLFHSILSLPESRSPALRCQTSYRMFICTHIKVPIAVQRSQSDCIEASVSILIQSELLDWKVWFSLRQSERGMDTEVAGADLWRERVCLFSRQVVSECFSCAACTSQAYLAEGKVIVRTRQHKLSSIWGFFGLHLRKWANKLE